MKNIRIIFLLLIVTILIQACKKDDEVLTNMIYGTWRTPTPVFDNLLGSSDITTYTFMPNYCRYEFLPSDGSTFKMDSLTFFISEKTLYIYKKDGSMFEKKIIDKLNRSTLVLDSEKLKRDEY